MTMTFEDKIRAKLEALKNPQRGQGLNKNRWSAKVDSQTDVRLLRYPYQDVEEPFIELYFHYDIGSPFLCPKKLKNTRCPVCEASDKLYRKRTDEDYKASKKLRPVQRFVAVLVDRNDPSVTPKFWTFNAKIYSELLSKLVDRDYKTYLDPLKGFDLTVTSQKIKGKQYADTSIQFRPVKGPLADSEKKIKEVVESVPKVETVFDMLSEEEIMVRLNDFWMNGGSQFPPKQQQSTEKKKEDSSSYGEQSLDVDSAFEKALDD